MTKIINYIHSKEWAMFVATVTAVLMQFPALVDLVQGELQSDDWTPMGLVVLVAGFLIRSNVFKRASVEKTEQRKTEVELQLLAAHEQLSVFRAQSLAAQAVLEAAREGQPLPMVGVIGQAN